MKETRTIHCEVHGHIELPARLFKLIDTPVVQRLRRLSQCGTVSYVYPGCTHTRFEHSIGVAYLAGEFMTHLQKTQPELKITDREVFCVQAAGLLHDIGHGPFSHLFEDVVKGFSHENQTARLLPLLKPEIDLDADDWVLIRQCISGYYDEDDSREFLYQIVANKESGLDVDKMDYIMRDSKNTSIPLGCDVKRLVMSSRAIKVNGVYKISYQDKVVSDIVSLFRTRYKLHTIVYQHKVASAVGLMLKSAILISDMDGVFPGGLPKICEDPKQFLKLDDSIYNLIQNSDSKAATTILERIERRDVYKCVLETPKRMLQEVWQKLIGNRLMVDIQHISIHWGLGNKNPLEFIYFFNKRDLSAAHRLSWFGDDMPQKFKTESIRVYVNDPKESLDKVKKLLGINDTTTPLSDLT
jgi:HD superfamily phosphohydrolase